MFFCLTTTVVGGKDYHYTYTDNCGAAYKAYMALDMEGGDAHLKKELLADPYNLMATYISDYKDCLLLLFNGNRVDYEQLKGHQSEKLRLLGRGDEGSPWHRLCTAGIYMHWAFAHLRFNENLKAANNFRKSYQLLKENKAAYPDFAYNDIFLGIEEATVGAIPDNYKWIASLFGMRGNVQQGVGKVRGFVQGNSSGTPLYEEAVIYLAYMQYYLLSDKDAAWATVSSSKFGVQDNLINCFVKCNIALNYRKAEEAESVLKIAKRIKGYEHYPIFKYEYGYALLHKLDRRAVGYFSAFIKNYNGKMYVKDAWQKMSFLYYLNNDQKSANYCKSKIVHTGSTNTDGDKQALRFAQQSSWPDKHLLKAQLLTDGGYYTDANTLLNGISIDNYATVASQLEYYFRKARVRDELGHYEDAVILYKKAIEVGKYRQEQFAARSALQLGFLYESKGDNSIAIDMYELALSMKDHDFKNSIDQQAKAGINRLR